MKAFPRVLREQTIVLELRHPIAASRKRVFAAWTTPEDIQHWFGPETCSVRSARVDLKVGGEYCFDVFSQRTGETQIRGIYKEVSVPERLVYTWQCGCEGELPGEESLVTVDFIDLGSSTEIRLRHEQLPSTKVSDDHRHGWIGTFEKLEKYIAN
jgi:uncharacterized protein YndB with AHSA1/START domain